MSSSLAMLELSAFLPYRLNRAAAALSDRFAQLYRERHGLTRAEWRLLATLGQFGQMTATDIGRHSAMHKSKVSRAASALEERRWLARVTDENDRRFEHLSLTPAGRNIYEGLVPLALDFERRLQSDLAEGERDAIERGLAALERALGLEP